MLQLLNDVTAVSIVLTGMAVLAMGEWRCMRLKFAAISISTAGAIGAIGIYIATGGQGCMAEDVICLYYQLYGIVRNAAFILFHIAVGRDAIKFKKKDRRGARKESVTNKKDAPIWTKN